MAYSRSDRRDDSQSSPVLWHRDHNSADAPARKRFSRKLSTVEIFAVNPEIIDTDTGRTLWRVSDCAEHCGVTNSTWRSYALKKLPPEPVAHLDPRIPLWDAESVKQWHAERPGRGNWGTPPSEPTTD